MNYAATREWLREFIDLLPDGANGSGRSFATSVPEACR